MTGLESRGPRESHGTYQPGWVGSALWASVSPSARWEYWKKHLLGRLNEVKNAKRASLCLSHKHVRV